MVIIYVTRTQVIHPIVTGDIDAVVCESINVMVGQITASTILQSQINVTDLSFAAPNEEV